MGKKEFLDAKEKALKSLQKACIEQKLDEGIYHILQRINSYDGFYTSSSCAGRIVLLEIPIIGDKKAAKFLGIWHRPITQKELQNAMTNAKSGYLWLLAQSPILHIGVDTLQRADRMVKIAVSCGLKNSTIKSTEKKIIIEICSTEHLDALLGKDGKFYCKKEFFSLVLEISNEVIHRSQNKIKRLEQKLKNMKDFI